jgi:hypothetical protein
MDLRASATPMAPPPKPFEGPSPEARPDRRIAAPPIDASDELMPRDRRPPSEVPGRPGEAPVEPEPEHVPLSPRPPVRPNLSLPASIAEVFGSKWAESRAEASVAAEPSTAPREDTRPAPGPDPASFDSMWPSSAEPRSSVSTMAEAPEPAPESEAPRREVMPTPETLGDAEPSAILKSGVIDGMAYRLYTDGSITADLPQGTMRFASVEALRVHLDKGG